MLAALEDEARAPSYYAFAALYALPLVRSGLEVDGFALALLLVGAAHVQAERVAATEPETQAAAARVLSPLGAVKAGAGAARAFAAAFLPQRRAAPSQLPAAGGGEAGGRRGAAEFGIPAPPRTRSDELAERLREEELADFDRRMRDREAARRRGGGGGGGA